MFRKTGQSLYIASNNQHKVQEFSQLLAGTPIKVNAIGELGDINWIESGQTFHENALIKAKAIREYTKEMIIADDSGLVVPALNGQPGVYSSRFAAENATDQQNYEKLIALMADLKEQERQAYFICVLCFLDQQGEARYFEGRCQGRIIDAPRGKNGFGYDPIFIPEPFSKTMAELTSVEKNQISHRRKALDDWRNALNDLLRP